MDNPRERLQIFSRQYDNHMLTVAAIENNLITLLDNTFPGANYFFDSPVSDDGRQKWVDFVAHFWHCDIVANSGLRTFTKQYKKWCKINGYEFYAGEAKAIHVRANELLANLPTDTGTKLMVTTSAHALTGVMKAALTAKSQSVSLARLLPEYNDVLGMYDGDATTVAGVIAENRVPLRFHEDAFDLDTYKEDRLTQVLEKAREKRIRRKIKIAKIIMGVVTFIFSVLLYFVIGMLVPMF